MLTQKKQIWTSFFGCRNFNFPTMTTLAPCHAKTVLLMFIWYKNLKSIFTDKVFFWIVSIILVDWATAPRIPVQFWMKMNILSMENLNIYCSDPSEYEISQFSFSTVTVRAHGTSWDEKITAGARYGWKLIKREK